MRVFGLGLVASFDLEEPDRRQAVERGVAFDVLVSMVVLVPVGRRDSSRVRPGESIVASIARVLEATTRVVHPLETFLSACPRDDGRTRLPFDVSNRRLYT